MIKTSKADKETVLKRLYSGEIDAVCLSTSSLVDEILLTMKKHGILSCLHKAFVDKRSDNTCVPFDIMLTLAVSAKMRVHTSLTDIPFALTDHRTIAELGYAMYDNENELGKGLMAEGTIRHILGKYTPSELLSLYNNLVQNHIPRTTGIAANVHILDCTKLRVNINNKNYEASGIVSDDEGASRGYKLATLRGIVKDSGIIEHIEFGPINTHDLMLSWDMLLQTSVLKHGDILINDRGFLSREMINTLKNQRGVDTYVPLRKNMDAYDVAVRVAEENGQWINHPKRANQKIAFVDHVGDYWLHDHTDVPLNACVVKGENGFRAVFVTTDTKKSAADIIKTYEMRPEIEEDYRQIKDFWKIEDFKSTKLHVIAFHVVCVLTGYLFYQLYGMLPEGEKHAGRSLPVLLKGYQPKTQKHAIVYSGDRFGIFTFVEFIDIYARCGEPVRERLKPILELA